MLLGRQRSGYQSAVSLQNWSKKESSYVGIAKPMKPWSDYVREDLAELRLSYDWYRVSTGT